MVFWNKINSVGDAYNLSIILRLSFQKAGVTPLIQRTAVCRRLFLGKYVNTENQFTTYFLKLHKYLIMDVL